MAPSTTPGLVWGSPLGLGGGIVNDPGAGPNADNRLTVFVQGGGNDLYIKSQNRDGSWQPDWIAVAGTPGTVGGSPIALRGPDGILNAFWRGPDNSVWTLRQSVINGGYAAPLKIASGAMSNPAAALNADGRISVFYNGTDRALWHVDQAAVNYASYGQPASLAGDTGANNNLAPTAARGGDGRLQVFVHGAANEVWGIAQKAPDSTANWDAYFPVSARNVGVIGSPFAVTDADQRIRVFWRDGTTGFFAAQQAGYSSWDAPGTLSGTIAETPTAILAQDGRLEVFVVATDRSIYVTEQTAVNVSTFTQVGRLGGNIPVPCVPVPVKTSDNRILLPHHGSDNGVWAFQQVWG